MSVTTTDDDLLTAYLDDELGLDERNDLQKRLLEEDALSERLSQLQSDWDCLEVLDKDIGSNSVVQSTLEMAITEIEPASSNEVFANPWLKTGLVTALLAGVAIATGIAYRIVERRTLLSHLEELAIARDLEAYQHGSDLSFMRELAANPEWARLIRTTTELETPRGRLSPEAEELLRLPLTSADVRSTMQQLEQLPSEDRLYLQDNLDRFVRMDEREKNKLRNTAEAVSIQVDRDDLFKTMRDFTRWRSRLDDETRRLVDAEDPEIRSEAIEKAIDDSRGWMAVASGSVLDDEVIERIDFALDRFLQDRIASDPDTRETIDNVRKLAAKRFSHLPSEEISRQRLANFFIKRGIFGNYRDPRFRGMPPPPSHMQGLTPFELDSLNLILTDEAARLLD
ncbi:MAG: hypothetical protein AAF664_02850, partial [Planctomycetota bacterium]